MERRGARNAPVSDHEIRSCLKSPIENKNIYCLRGSRISQYAWEMTLRYIAYGSFLDLFHFNKPFKTYQIDGGKYWCLLRDRILLQNIKAIETKLNIFRIIKVKKFEVGLMKYRIMIVNKNWTGIREMLCLIEHYETLNNVMIW